MRSPLISVAALQAALAAPEPPVVLDVRYRLGQTDGADEYAAGHVPGAVYIDLDTDLAGPPGAGGRHPLPAVATFEAAMRRAGVSNHRAVVVYDNWFGHAAARCWWLLRHHGHAYVQVLDGAWPAWEAAGGVVESCPAFELTPGDFIARPGSTPTVEPDQVPQCDVLIDARAPERFRGDVEPVDARAGHIPGAVNLPTAGNLRADGTFHDVDTLRERYAAAAGATSVAVYCGSGVTAAHNLLAMEVAGLQGALYPGSWSGWITDPSRPIAGAAG